MDDPHTPDLTDAEKRLLTKAGASSYVLKICQHNVRELDKERRDGKPVNKNSTLASMKYYLRGGPKNDPLLTEENADEFEPLAEGFMEHLWRGDHGDLYMAYENADPNNKVLMKEVFGLRQINNDRPNGLGEVTA